MNSLNENKEVWTNDGRPQVYKKTDEHYIKANGKWKDLDVIVLTNSECASARR